MDIEFVDDRPEPADEPEDVLSVGPPRHLPRWIGTATVALLVVAGGAGWLATRSGDSPSRPAPSQSAAVPSPAPTFEDVLAGCPNTLACDATHQMQQHQIDMIRQAMLQRNRHQPAVHARVSWTAGFNSGGTMVR